MLWRRCHMTTRIEAKNARYPIKKIHAHNAKPGDWRMRERETAYVCEKKCCNIWINQRRNKVRLVYDSCQVIRHRICISFERIHEIATTNISQEKHYWTVSTSLIQTDLWLQHLIYYKLNVKCFKFVEYIMIFVMYENG